MVGQITMPIHTEPTLTHKPKSGVLKAPWKVAEELQKQLTTELMF
jgi:hypothetical protein